MSQYVEVTYPIARKAHLCEVCGPHIKPGDQYAHTVSFGYGDFGVFRCCLVPCLNIVNKCLQDGFYDALAGGVTGDDAREWAAEHTGIAGQVDDPDAALLIQRLDQTTP